MKYRKYTNLKYQIVEDDERSYNLEETVELLNKLDADKHTYLHMCIKLAKKLGFQSGEEFHDAIKGDT